MLSRNRLGVFNVPDLDTRRKPILYDSLFKVERL